MPAPAPDAVLDGAFIVVPAYNEARVIREVVDGLAVAFRHVVVVDDGSADGTAAALRGSHARVVRHHINLGQGAALQTGISFALEREAAFVVTFDADGQHRVQDAVEAVRLLAAGGCDVVCGSRFLGTASSNVPAGRKVLLKAAVAFANATSGARMTDAHNGLRALNRRAASSLDLSQSGMAHASEIISQLRAHEMTIREIPVQVRYTEYSMAKGQSSLNAINILFDLLIGRFLK